jgi:hypothetical protein
VDAGWLLDALPEKEQRRPKKEQRPPENVQSAGMWPEISKLPGWI